MAQSSQDEAAQRLKVAEEGLEEQLEGSADPLLLFVAREQLISFRSKIRRMRSQLESGHLPSRDEFEPEMASEVINDWPLTSLGEKLIQAERAFQACLPPASADRR